MLIENQLSTLEQSLKLKALGVDQTSLFYWQKAKSSVHKESIMYGWTSDALCSAYTLAELGEMLNDDFWFVKWSYVQSRASAAADQLILLLEKGINLNGVNKRLTAPNYPPRIFEPTNWEKK